MPVTREKMYKEPGKSLKNGRGAKWAKLTNFFKKTCELRQFPIALGKKLCYTAYI